MMAPRRVIIVHEADRLLAPKRAKDEDEGGRAPRPQRRASGVATTPAEELEAYIEQPEPMTTLVFVSGPLDANRRVVKLLRKHADVVDCGTLHDAREAAMWITKRLEKDELAIEPKAISLLLRPTGLTLGRIRAGDREAGPVCGGRVDDHRRARARRGDPAGGIRGHVRADGGGAERQCAARAARSLRADRLRHPAAGDSRPVAGRHDPPAAGCAREERARGRVSAPTLAIKSSSGTPQYLLECLVVELCAR